MYGVSQGAIGSQFCDLALEGGHTLTLFVRKANKIPQSLHDHDSVAIIEGKLEDEASLDEIALCDADAFVSFAGPPAGSKGTVSRASPLRSTDMITDDSASP